MTLQEAIKELEKAFSEACGRPICIKMKRECHRSEPLQSPCYCVPVQELLKALLMQELLKRVLRRNPKEEKYRTDDIDGMYSLCISGVSGEAIAGIKTALLAFGEHVPELSDSELDDLAARIQEDAAALEDNCK